MRPFTLKNNAMPKPEEYKDAKGENRMKITAANGNLYYSSTEGYKNKKDMREAAKNAALDILENYPLNPDQESRLFDLAGKIIEKGR